ncbi:LysM peptidoglycan-binding domain-containing protein [Vicingaceae bacterium]|nr:LysM peptidoglycan-binding domain-containing protein [Vicingaceae bacterium]
MRIEFKYCWRLIVVIFITSQSIYAQTDSLEVHNIKGKEYYIHIVQQGESLYFMHKKYNVPLDVIKKENPSVADGLSIGEKVFIPVKRDAEVAVKTDGNFINHTVLKGQTLYAISKMYKVSQIRIISVNQKEVADGISEGAILKIPVLNIKTESVPELEVMKPQSQTHIVKKGETLYSLSKLYETTPDLIKLVNDGLKQGLKTGEVIYVPSKHESDDFQLPTSDTSIVSSIEEKLMNWISDTGLIVKKSEYSIGLMLPFYLDENDEMVQSRSALSEKSIYRKSKPAIELYNGLKMALDSISTDSCKFKIYVYDTKGNDSLRTQNLLLKPEMLTHDLFIGPLYANNFKRVAEFAKANRIPIVTPVKQSNKLLLGNQFIFKAIPSKSTTLLPICKLVADSFKTENVMAIEYENAKEKSLVDLFVKSYNTELLKSEDTTLYSAIKVLKIDKNIADIVTNLKLNQNNVIFVPASDQTFITNLFSLLSTTLNKKIYKDCKVTLVGVEEWMNYENIDLEYFQRLNVHFCATKFIDYNDSITSVFAKKYVNKFETYPSKYTFLGFDIGYYFGDGFISEGTVFSKSRIEENSGRSINLNFFKTGIESGFENQNSFLLRFEDYELKRIN